MVALTATAAPAPERREKVISHTAGRRSVVLEVVFVVIVHQLPYDMMCAA